jgi:hypothetical protein
MIVPNWIGYGGFFAFLCFWSYSVWGWIWFASRIAPAALGDYAESQDLQVLYMRRQHNNKGPFQWDCRGAYPVVYRVDVLDRRSVAWTGWVRIWSNFWMEGYEIDVRWDSVRRIR